MSDRIDSVDALEALVGKCSLGARMKEIDFLDAHGRRLVEASTLAVTATSDARGVLRIHAHGGPAGFARAREDGKVHLPLRATEGLAPAQTTDGTLGVGALFFVPGLGETLRLNGRGSRIVGSPDGTTTELVLEVKEAFVHCAKALIRSHLWESTAEPRLSADARVAPDRAPLADPLLSGFLARSPFALIASVGRLGTVDVSPKGDPPGFLLVRDERTLVLPDRPGNQRVDTFRNVLETGRVALLALVPGERHVAEIHGSARLVTDPALLALLSVEGRQPKLALVIDVEAASLAPSDAIHAGDPWNATRHTDLSTLPSVAAVLRDHVKQSRAQGIGAKMLRTVVSERVITAGLARDYKEGLY